MDAPITLTEKPTEDRASGRRVVLFFDGTSNEVVTDASNVLRLFRCLIRDDSQLAYYEPGVGTLLDPYALTDAKRLFRKLYDFAVGHSLQESVIAGY